MSFRSLTFDDSGMYQCIAENHHGLLYANAELRVFGESRFWLETHRKEAASDTKVTFFFFFFKLTSLSSLRTFPVPLFNGQTLGVKVEVEGGAQ